MVVGGAGFVGSSVAAILGRSGGHVTVIDRERPLTQLAVEGARQLEADVLVDEVALPAGHVVLALGNGNPRPRWPWTLLLEIAVSTARLAPQLAGRTVTLISSVEMYGRAAGPLREDTPPELPWSSAELEAWRAQATAAAQAGPCPPWRAAAMCRAFAERDPSGRWIYGAAKLVQEAIVRDAVGNGRLTILRLANTFGIGQERVVMRLIRRALSGRPLRVTESRRSFLSVNDPGRLVLAGPPLGTFNIGGPAVWLPDLAAEVLRVCRSASQLEVVAAPDDDACGLIDVGRLTMAGLHTEDLFRALPGLVRAATVTPRMFSRPLPVVIPSRPVKPDVVADRQQECLWTGRVKHGNRFSTALIAGVAERLGVAPERVLATSSGTDALLLAIVATAGPARPGQVAAVPSFTFPATAEAAAQLGYEVRFVDIDPDTLTIDRTDLDRVMADTDVAVVIGVDTFGNPLAYDGVLDVCRRHGVPLVADSAAALGATYHGEPVGLQADAHAYSMSFAKGLTAGGAGGAVVVPDGTNLGHWTRSRLMDEVHAVVALDQLVVLEDLLARRAAIARVYADAILPFPWVRAQAVTPYGTHTYVHWVSRIPAGSRAAVMSALGELGIGTRDYFQALHRIGWRSERPLPATSRLHGEAVALPMSSEMTIDDAERVATGLHHTLERTAQLLAPPVHAAAEQPLAVLAVVDG